MDKALKQSELDLFRDNVRRFVKAEILPEYEVWEKNEHMPRQVWSKLGESGLLCVDLPEKYGGAGATFVFSMVILEELSRAGCAGVSTSVCLHSDIVAQYIHNWGTDEQKENYLPKMAAGERVGAIAMTEPGTGSDLKAIKTNAVEDGDAVVINGTKTFITNGISADVVIVVARTHDNRQKSDAMSLFLVDTDTQGFSCGRKLEKIGLHASDTAELFFDNVRIAKTALLGGPGQGFAILMAELQRERLALAVMAVAAAEGAMQWTIDYVKDRKAFKQPISAFQNTRFRMAEMQTDIRVNKAFLNECIDRFAKGELDIGSTAMVKLSCSEMQGRVMDGCLQLYGGYGYMREYPISRAYLDARVQRIYAGTSEIMKEVIARSLLD